MLTNALVEHCSPTLAGIKTGNMFSVNTDSTDIISEIRNLNRMMTKKGLCLIPLKKSDTSTLIYLYRPDLLKRDLNLPEAEEILEKKGYPCGKPECCLARLIRHFMEDDQFPHEIGLFLGYPPSDVKGFMEDTRKGVKCNGCWKAYGNECEAKKLFGRYKKCREIYCKEVRKGKPLEAPTVGETDSGCVTGKSVAMMPEQYWQLPLSWPTRALAKMRLMSAGISEKPFHKKEDGKQLRFPSIFIKVELLEVRKK